MLRPLRIAQEFILKINKEKFYAIPKRFERKKALIICYLKDTGVCEEYWPADYLKVIYYGKERPRDPHSVFPLCKDRHVLTMLLSVDEV